MASSTSARASSAVVRPGPAREGGRRAGRPSPPARCSARRRAALAGQAQQVGQFAQSGPATRGQPGAQPGGEGGAGPARGDGDRDRTVAVHRGQDEGAVRHVVGAVDPHPGRLGIGVDRAVDGRDPGGASPPGGSRPRHPGRRGGARGSAGSAPSWHHRTRGRSPSPGRRSAAARPPCGRPRDLPRPRGRPARPRRARPGSRRSAVRSPQ